MRWRSTGCRRSSRSSGAGSTSRSWRPCAPARGRGSTSTCSTASGSTGSSRGTTFPRCRAGTLVHAWHELDPWPDVVEGLTRLKERFIIAPCSNGHFALQVALARRGGLPWDAILGAELARAYKPDPEVYQRSVHALGLEMSEACMVAAHNDDLAAAAALGMRTVFVARPGEDAEPTGDHDVVAWDFIELAEEL